jgi:hypothetical protein
MQVGSLVMPVVEEQVAVTLMLPRSVVERIGEAAGRDNHTVEDEMRTLIGLALAIEGEPEELAAKAERDYVEHLAATGRQRLTSEELWEQMRRIRDEVASSI